MSWPTSSSDINHTNPGGTDPSNSDWRLPRTSKLRVESELALEQLEQGTAARELSRSDQWPTAVNQLARQLNARIEVSRPFLRICLDEIKTSRDSHPN